MAKFWWRFGEEHGALWRQVIKEKSGNIVEVGCWVVLIIVEVPKFGQTFLKLSCNATFCGNKRRVKA